MKQAMALQQQHDKEPTVIKTKNQFTVSTNRTRYSNVNATDVLDLCRNINQNTKMLNLPGGHGVITEQVRRIYVVRQAHETAIEGQKQTYMYRCSIIKQL